jgi:DNA-directed RNA polymerase subunit RPC12/RpoP
MNKDEILVIKYPFLMRTSELNQMYKNILEQRVNGLILLPDYCEVVTAPKDVEIKVEKMENDEPSSPWTLVDNPNYSPFDHSYRAVSLHCDGCGKHIDKWDDDYVRCPYCGKKHMFYTNEELAEAFDNGRGG